MPKPTRRSRRVGAKQPRKPYRKTDAQAKRTSSRTKNTSNAVGSSPAPFLGLPSEIIIEIAEHLRPKPHCYPRDNHNCPHSGCPHHARNKQRMKDLWSLCLTSKRISALVTGVLYSNIILDSGREKLVCPLSHLCRTLLERPALRENIQYIESIHESKRGPRLMNNGEVPKRNEYNAFHAVSVAARGIWEPPHLPPAGKRFILTWIQDCREVGVLIALSPNVTELRLHSPHHIEPLLEPDSPYHGLKRLKKLSVGSRLSVQESPNHWYPVSFPWFVERLQKLPELEHFYQADRYLGEIVGGIEEDGIEGVRVATEEEMEELIEEGIQEGIQEGIEQGMPDRSVSDAKFPKLKSLFLVELTCDVEDVTKTLKRCDSLVEFTFIPKIGDVCEWYPELQDCHEGICKALSFSKQSLTRLDLRYTDGDEWLDQLGLLSDFPCLQHLTIVQELLLGGPLDWDKGQPKISVVESLPKSLQTLHVYMDSDHGSDESHAEARVWWAFARDLESTPRPLPFLKKVTFQLYWFHFMDEFASYYGTYDDSLQPFEHSARYAPVCQDCSSTTMLGATISGWGDSESDNTMNTMTESDSEMDNDDETGGEGVDNKEVNDDKEDNKDIGMEEVDDVDDHNSDGTSDHDHDIDDVDDHNSDGNSDHDHDIDNVVDHDSDSNSDHDHDIDDDVDHDNDSNSDHDHDIDFDDDELSNGDSYEDDYNFMLRHSAHGHMCTGRCRNRPPPFHDFLEWVPLATRFAELGIDLKVRIDRFQGYYALISSKEKQSDCADTDNCRRFHGHLDVVCKQDEDAHKWYMKAVTDDDYL